MKTIPFRRDLTKVIVTLSFSLFLIDLFYKSAHQISYLNRDRCILYRTLPKIGFLFYEYFLELFLSVFIGIFLAVLLESFFKKYGRFYPRNSILAFCYASLLPLCACSTIPLIITMRQRLPLRTVITFTVAAPLLSPYVIFLSYTVLGLKYALLRISSSFLLAILSGVVVELFCSSEDDESLIVYSGCNKEGCGSDKTDIYLRTYEITLRILPFLIVSGIAGVLIELTAPSNFLITRSISNDFFGMLLSILIGIPIYLCHGAEVLLLRPLMHQCGLPLGHAVAFSLASTSTCITSLVILYRILGKKLTGILLLNILIVTLLLGSAVNYIYGF